MRVTEQVLKASFIRGHAGMQMKLRCEQLDGARPAIYAGGACGFLAAVVSRRRGPSSGILESLRPDGAIVPRPGAKTDDSETRLGGLDAQALGTNSARQSGGPV